MVQFKFHNLILVFSIHLQIVEQRPYDILPVSIVMGETKIPLDLIHIWINDIFEKNQSYSKKLFTLEKFANSVPSKLNKKSLKKSTK